MLNQLSEHWCFHTCSDLCNLSFLLSFNGTNESSVAILGRMLITATTAVGTFTAGPWIESCLPLGSDSNFMNAILRLIMWRSSVVRLLSSLGMTSRFRPFDFDCAGSHPRCRLLWQVNQMKFRSKCSGIGCEVASWSTSIYLSIYPLGRGPADSGPIRWVLYSRPIALTLGGEEFSVNDVCSVCVTVG